MDETLKAAVGFFAITPWWFRLAMLYAPAARLLAFFMDRPVTLAGCWHLSAAALMPGGGAIVNTSSTSGLLGNAGQVNYSATKAGIIGFTRSLSREVARFGVTVNAVAPGFIATDMSEAVRNKAGDFIKKVIS